MSHRHDPIISLVHDQIAGIWQCVAVSVWMAVAIVACSDRDSCLQSVAGELPTGAVAQLGSQRFRHAAEGIHVIRFSPDGRRIASGGRDQMIHVWDTETGAEIWRFDPFRGQALDSGAGWVLSLAFSADGRFLASSTGWQVRIWDLDEGRRARILATSTSARVGALAFAPDGTILAVGLLRLTDTTGAVQFFDAESGRSPRRFEVPTRVSSLSFSPDGRYLLSGGYPYPARVFDLDSGELILTLESEQGAHSAHVRFALDGNAIVASVPMEGVVVWGFPDGEVHGILPGNDSGQIAVDASGGLLAVDGPREPGDRDSCRAQLWDLETGEPRGERVSVPSARFSQGCALALSPDSKLLALSGRFHVRIFDLENGKLRPLPAGHQAGVVGLRFAEDGSMLLSVDRAGEAWTWDPAGGAGRRIDRSAFGPYTERLQKQLLPPLRSPDGSLTAAAYFGTVIVRQVSGRSERAFVGHLDWVNCLAFSPDSRLLASGGDDGQIFIWSLEPAR